LSGLLYLPLLQTSVESGDDVSVAVHIALGAISLAVGLIGGLVGIALGMIRLPAMTLLGVNPLVAASTNLLVTVFSAVAGSWPAILENRVNWRVVVLLGVPGFIGALIGGYYADALPVWLLLSAVGFFMVWSSIMMILQATKELQAGSEERKNRPRGGRGDLNPKVMVREGLVGAIIGFVGGAVGVALGVLRMPALVQVLKMEVALAAGTNLMITILISLSGFAGHLIGGRLDWPLILNVGITGSVGMYVGSRMTTKIDPARLRLIVGATLLLLAPLVFYDAFTR
jgi:uncharacterized membrane protein YfcA